jgi:hypothetical protein
MFYLVLFQMLDMVYSLSIRSENPFDKKYLDNTKNTFKDNIFGSSINNMTTVEPSAEEKLYNEIWFYIIISFAGLILCFILCFIKKCCC